MTGAPDTALVERCLEDGARFERPSTELRVVIALLEARRLARPRWSRGFRCHEPGDDPDPDRPRGGCCAGWIELPAGWPDEQPSDPDDELAWDEWLGREVEFECPACGRLHAVDRHPRTVHDHVDVRVDEDALHAWMEARVVDLDPNARPLRDGVGWRLLLGSDEIVLVWLDRSQASRATTRAFAAAQPTVYLTPEPRRWSTRFRDDPGIVVVSVGAWVAEGDVVLLEAAERVAAGPVVVAEPPLRSWARPRTIELEAVVPPGPIDAEAGIPAAIRFPAPTGTAWNQVTVWLVDGDTVRIILPGAPPRSFTAAELGLTNTRSRDRRRTKGWAILEALCEGHGACGWRVGGCASYDAFKVQVSTLGKVLRGFLGIEASPFHPTSPRDGLRAVFRAGPLPEPEVYVGEDRWGRA